MNMEVVSAGNSDIDSNDIKTLFSSRSRKLWNRLINVFPQTHSSFLGKISNLYIQFTRARFRTRRSSLPLPLPRKSLLELPEVPGEASRIFDVLEDILEHVFLDLHKIQKNLQFWHSRAQGSNAKRVYFMIFERGPRAFIEGTTQLIHKFVNEGSLQHVSHTASAYVSEKITVLTHLRCALASFLAQVYMEVDKVGEELVKNPEKSLPSLLVVVNELFLKLEASIGHLHAMSQSDSSVDESSACPLLFEKLPEVNQEGSQWTDCETRDAINLIYINLHKLDSFLSLLVAKHKKPRKATLYWTRYTCGLVGLSVCSMWLIRHSSLVGSPDIDNWIREAKDSTFSFWNDHVEQPLLSIRDELFETFKRRDQGVMEVQEVQLTASSLHRMLLAFCQQTKGQELPESTSDEEMLEIVMARYEKEMMHPIQNLLSGELARALLIQVQKLKLDIDRAMLELDQILRANQINFAVLAALPAFFISLILVYIVRAWFKQDTRAEGRGRIARLQRRLLIVEVQKRIAKYQIFMDQGLEKDAQFMYGLVLYSLNRLYHAVKWHAKETGEWESLREDIIDIAKPGLQIGNKQIIVSRLVGVYECTLPSCPKR